MEKSQKIWQHWILAIGASSMLTQLVMLREFLSIFHGNELVMGITLAIWLILTASGALLFRIIPFSPFKFYTGYILQVFLSLIPVASLLFLRYARSTWFYSGASVDLTDIVLLSTLSIMPYCLISGYLFPAIADILCQSTQNNAIPKAYYLDTFGAVLAGAVFSFVLIYYLSHIQILCIAGLVITLISIEYSKFYKLKSQLYIVSLITTVFLLWMIHINPDKISKQHFYKNQNILFSKETPYGNITITKTNEQINFFENGSLLFTSNNTIENEETVHYTMIQHHNPKKILLIGGGVSGVLLEIRKYPIEKIDYVEINPKIIETGQFFTSNIPNCNKIQIIEEDAKSYIKNTNKKYDVAIIHLSAPHNLSSNRYYTYEFFKLLKTKLNTNGIASIALQGNTNYLSAANTYLFGSIYHAIRKNFIQINIFTGFNNYFVMSDNTLTFDITSKTINKKIENKYVNEYYTDKRLLENKHSQIVELIKYFRIYNSDMHPVSAYFQLTQWLSKFKIRENTITIFIIVIILGILAVLILSNINKSSIFASGFSSLSLEIIYLLIFQTIYGYIYNMLGIIITIYMFGIGLGVYFCNQIFKIITLRTIQRLHIYLFIYALITPAILFLLNKYQFGTFLTYLIILGFTADIAIVTGMLFTANSMLYKAPIKKNAANLYGFDLLGAASGAILITSLLLPLFGFVKVCIFIGLLNLTIIIKTLFIKEKLPIHQ